MWCFLQQGLAWHLRVSVPQPWNWVGQECKDPVIRILVCRVRSSGLGLGEGLGVGSSWRRVPACDGGAVLYDRGLLAEPASWRHQDMST